MNPVSRLRDAALIGIVAALSIGLLDAALALWSSPKEFDGLLAIPPAVLVTTVLAFAVFTLVALAARILGYSSTRVLAALGAGLAIFFVLASVTRLSLFPASPHALRLCILAFLSLPAAYGIGVFAERHPAPATRLGAFAYALPLSLTVVVAVLAELPSRGIATVALLVFALVLPVLALRLAGAARSMLLAAGALVVLGAAPRFYKRYLSESPGQKPSTSSHRVQHVFLIVADTLRSDAVSSLGGHPETPSIDRLAEDGILFSRAYAPSSWTLPAVASILTGLSPLVHGFHRINERPDLIPSRTNLAQTMSLAGYTTAALVANPAVEPETVITRGFSYFRASPGSELPHLSLGQVLFTDRARQFASPLSTSALTDRAIGWVREHRRDDGFLWLHYYDPHDPYEPPAQFLPKRSPPAGFGTSFSLATMATPEERDWIRSLYDGEVRYVDESVGRFLGVLRELGLYEDSLIVFVSDHGEEFLEHGRLFHGLSLYDEVLRVPLIVKLPGVHWSRRIDTPVDTTSLFATILDVCGLEVPRALSAGSLSPLLAGGAPRDTPLFATGLLPPADKESLRMGNLKYIRTSATGAEELYDLAKDPGERSSIAPFSPADLARMRDALSRRRQEEAALRRLYAVPGADDISPETIRRLRALGYVR